MKYSLEERLQIVTLFYKCQENAREAKRRYFATFNRHISINTILRIKHLFEETKSLRDKKRSLQRRRIRDNAIVNYFTHSPNNSVADAVRDIRYGQLRQRVSFGTVQRTLKRYKMIPFHILPVQHITPEQKELRFRFVSQIIMRQQNQDPDVFKKILWTDEASFTTSGMFNRHNRHYWAIENPRKFEQIKKQGRTSVNVWCGMINNKILGPIFYNGTLNGQRYLNFLQNEIEVFLDELPLETYRTLIWQQDGAPPHATRAVINFLNERHAEWIGRRGTIAWAPNSPELSHLDSFFWGHVKNVVYQERNNNIEEIMAKIVNEINRLNRENNILTASLQRLQRSYRCCFENNGGHIQHLNY